jgi:hypothetical protein
MLWTGHIAHSAASVSVIHQPIRRGSFEVTDLLLRELCSTRTNCKIAYQPA